MPWDQDRSRKRIEKIAGDIPQIEITDLTRKMDLDNVTLTKPKRVTGAHLYLGVDNEAALADGLNVDNPEGARDLARQVHLWQRECSRIVGTDFDAARIHFQGLRLHAVVYRPVSSVGEIATRAVLLAAAIEVTARRAFNPALPELVPLSCAAGASFGTTLATRSGSIGDSELLFLGDAANHGAKVLKGGTRLRITPELAALIDGALEIEATEDGDGAISVNLDEEVLKSAIEHYGIAWNLERSAARIEEDVDRIPPAAVGISKATTEIDKPRLSLSNCRLNDAVSLFGDIDGFTALVEDVLHTDNEAAAAIRTFHVMRAELRHVAVRDFPPTLRIQYQGDRIQALRHLPPDDEAARALWAVRVAAGWQSSMRQTLPEVLELDDLRLATGAAAGPTLISRLGERGNRDMICLGSGVRRAEAIQRRLDGDEIGLAGSVRELLPEDVAGLFAWEPERKAFVARDLRYVDLALAEEAARLDAGRPAHIARRDGALVVGTASAGVAAGGRLVTPRRRWAK